MKTSKPAVRFTIDFINKEIIGTKASFNKAGKGCGPEYEELAAKVAAHPDFKMAVKEQKHKSTKAKRTYDGLDTKFIKDYIATFGNADTLNKRYEAVQKMAEKSKTKAFPMTKKWFLEEFGTKEDGFDMDAAKERITQFRIAQAQKMAAEEVSSVPAAATEAQTKVAA